MAPHQGFEIVMLVLFSIGWYWSIVRMLRVRAAVGKSPAFVICVCTGYACGVASKMAAWAETGELSPLVWLYAWNLAVTGLDLALVLYFSRRPGYDRAMRAPLAP